MCHSLSFRRNLELRDWWAAPGAEALKLTGHFLCQRKREAQQEASSCFWKMSCATMCGKDRGCFSALEVNPLSWAETGIEVLTCPR